MVSRVAGGLNLADGLNLRTLARIGPWHRAGRVGHGGRDQGARGELTPAVFCRTLTARAGVAPVRAEMTYAGGMLRGGAKPGRRYPVRPLPLAGFHPIAPFEARLVGFAGGGRFELNVGALPVRGQVLRSAIKVVGREVGDAQPEGRGILVQP